ISWKGKATHGRNWSGTCTNATGKKATAEGPTIHSPTGTPNISATAAPSIPSTYGPCWGSSVAWPLAI
ncbi:uncharacterized protein METZ01_LOCUS515278, partial [marine metagenome]